MNRTALQLLAVPAPPPCMSRPAAAHASHSAAPHLTPCCSLHVAPCCPARRALLPRASRPAAASASRPTAASASRSAALRVAPCCSQRVVPYCPARRALLQPTRRALLQPARHALLPCAPRPAAASASRPSAASASCSAALRVAPCCSQRVAPCCSQRVTPYCSQRVALCCPSRRAPPSRPAATTAAAAAAARATAAAGVGAAGSAGSAAGAGGAGGATRSAGGAAGSGGATGSAGGAAGAGGATGSAGGAAGAGGAGPTTDRHCLSWPLSRQLQRLGVDSGGHCLSRTTPPLSSFASGFLSKPVQVVEALAAALGASESAAALGASESAAALGASESAAALGARASLATGPSSAEALHTFTLDSGASRCFFHDCTTLTPLATPVPVSLADPTGGPVVAQASTVLPCPAVPSGSLSGLHLPTFSTNLVSNAAIQDVWVDTFIPGGQRVAICTCSRNGHHLATFTRRPGSSLYTLTTASAQVAEADQVAASSQVSASGQLATSCSYRVLSHQTLLWHHRLGHPSLPRLRSMHSRLLLSGPPRSLPSLPRSPALPCLPYVEGRQRAAPHSSEFPPNTAPLQTLHVDVWGPAPADVSGVLIPWIRATRRQLRDRFSRDFPVLRLHSDKGGAVSLVRNAKASKLSSRTLRFVFLGFPTDAPPWQFYHPRSCRVFSSQDVTFDNSVCYYRLHPHASHPGPAPSGMSQVDPPPLVEPLEISSDCVGPAEGGDPTADDMAATRRSPRLETPLGFPPRASSPPPQPAAVDFGAETAGAEPGGAER
ncbi:unnamed protein product [Closterium sp. NIES-53]